MVDSDKNGLDENEKKQVKAISQIGSMLLAGAAGSDVNVAFDAATNEVSNNYLNHDQVDMMRNALSKCGRYDSACRQKIRNDFAKTSREQDEKLSTLCGKGTSVDACGKMFNDAVWYLATGVHESYNNGMWNLWTPDDKKAEYERGYSHAVKATPYGIDPKEFGLFTDKERRANLLLGGLTGTEGSILEGLGVGKTASVVLGNINPKNALGNTVKGGKRIAGTIGTIKPHGTRASQAGAINPRGKNNSNGTANSATAPKLTEQLRQENLNNI